MFTPFVDYYIYIHSVSLKNITRNIVFTYIYQIFKLQCVLDLVIEINFSRINNHNLLQTCNYNQKYSLYSFLNIIKIIGTRYSSKFSLEMKNLQKIIIVNHYRQQYQKTLFCYSQ